MLYARRPPFLSDDEDGLLSQVLSAKVHYHKRLWNRFSDESKGLVAKMLTRSIKSRPSAAECMAAANALHAEVENSSPKRVDHETSLDDESPGSYVEMSMEDLVSNLQRFSKNHRFEQHAFRLMARHAEHSSIRSLRAAFKKMDVQGRGALRLEDFKTGLASVGFHDAQQLERIFDSLDVDGSKEVDYTEFLAVVMHRVLESHREHLCWEAFRSLDKDGDGQIDAAELAETLGGSEDDIGVHMKEALELLSHADVDGDGKVSYEEFCRMMGKPAEESPTQVPTGIDG